MIAVNNLFIASNVFLFIYIWIAFIIKTIVLTRAIHKAVSRKTVNDFKVCGKGSFIWLCITLLILAFCFILANAIPVFSELAALVGALLAPWTGFFFPIMFVLKLRKDLKQKTKLAEKILMTLLLILVALLFVCGTYEGIVSIIHSSDAGHGAFDCITVNENLGKKAA